MKSYLILILILSNVHVILVELLFDQVSERICWLLSCLDGSELSFVVHVSFLSLFCFHHFLKFLLSCGQFFQRFGFELIEVLSFLSELLSPRLSFNSRLSMVPSQFFSSFSLFGLYLMFHRALSAVRCS